MDKPMYPEDREQLIIACRQGVDQVMAAAAASQAEAQHLVQQANFVAMPTLASANYILARMAKWNRVISDHCVKGCRLFEEQGLADYADCAMLASIDLDDFLAFVRKTKFGLADRPPQPAPQPGAAQQIMPTPAGPASAPGGAA